MRIVITDCDHGFFEPERDVIQEAGHQLSVEECKTPEDVLRTAQDADAMICQYAPITREVLAGLPGCRVVGRYGVGVDNVDVEAATEFGIQVVNVPDFCVEEVADHTMALILSVSRRVAFLDRCLKREPEKFMRNWNGRLSLLGDVGRAASQTIGLVGFGRIGEAVAKRALGFGYAIVAADPDVPDHVMSQYGAERLDLSRLLQTADFVSLHVPLTEKTRDLIGFDELRSMRSDAYIVNTARGGLIRESALVQALREKWIAGAALDVLEQEPFSPDHPFLDMDNVLLTPHVAFYSRESILHLKETIAHYTVNAVTGEGAYALVNSTVEARLNK